MTNDRSAIAHNYRPRPRPRPRSGWVGCFSDGRWTGPRVTCTRFCAGSPAICHLSFRSGLALPFLLFLRYNMPAISNLVSYSVDSEPNPLAASCKLDASVSLSRS